MGLAFKCDRCGEYYDTLIYNKVRGFIECTFDKYGDVKQYGTGMTWCPKCMEAFEKFKKDVQMENRHSSKLKKGITTLLHMIKTQK